MKLRKSIEIAVVIATLPWMSASPFEFGFDGKLKVTEPQGVQIPPAVLINEIPGFFPTDYVDKRYDSSSGVTITTEEFDSVNHFKMDIYQPKNPPPGPRNVIIFAHGRAGDKSQGYEMFLGYTNAADYGPVNAGYTAIAAERHGVPGLGDDWNTITADYSNAVSYIRANAARLNINPKRITFAGFSQGGSLAIAQSMAEQTDMKQNNRIAWLTSTQMNDIQWRAEVRTISAAYTDEMWLVPDIHYLINLNPILDQLGIFNFFHKTVGTGHGYFSLTTEMRNRQQEFIKYAFSATNQATLTGLKVELRQISATDNEIVGAVTGEAGAKVKIIASTEYSTVGKQTPEGLLYLNENKLTTLYDNATIPSGNNGLPAELGTLTFSVKPVKRTVGPVAIQAVISGRGVRLDNMLTNLGVAQ